MTGVEPVVGQIPVFSIFFSGNRMRERSYARIIAASAARFVSNEVL